MKCMKIYFHFPLGVVNGCSNPSCFVCLTQLISLDGKSLLPCQSMPKIILRPFSICCSKPRMMSYRIIVTIMKDIFSYDFLYQTLYTYIFLFVLFLFAFVAYLRRAWSVGSGRKRRTKKWTRCRFIFCLFTTICMFIHSHYHSLQDCIKYQTSQWI